MVAGNGKLDDDRGILKMISHGIRPPKWVKTSVLDVVNLYRQPYGKAVAAAVGGLLMLFLLIHANSGGTQNEIAEVNADTSLNLKPEPLAELKTKNLTVHELRKSVDTLASAHPRHVEVSLVAACHNRIKDMEVALQTWLRIGGVDEVIVVDWTSADKAAFYGAVEKSGQLGAKIVLARVSDQKEWVLTRAYNLAIRLATGKFILKVDCDTLVSDGFLRRHPASEDLFYALKNPRNNNEKKLTGVVFTSRKSLEEIHGYDERLTRYGYENQDLIERLTKFGREWKELDPDYVNHLPHSDPKESTDVASIHKVSVEVNRAILENVPSWTDVQRETPTASTYDFSIAGTFNATWSVSAKVLAAPEAIHDLAIGANGTAVGLASRRFLHDDYDVPHDLLAQFSENSFYDLLLMIYSPVLPGRVLFVDAGKSITSFLSATAAAARMQRPLVIAWGGAVQDGTIADLWDLQVTNNKIEVDTQAGHVVSARNSYQFCGFSESSENTREYTVIFSVESWPCADMRKNPDLCKERDPAYANMEVHLPGMDRVRAPPLQHVFIPASIENPFVLETHSGSTDDVAADPLDTVDFSYVLNNWAVPSANVRRMLRPYKDYIGATCVLGQRGIRKLEAEKDSIVGDVFVFGTEGKDTVDWLGKEMHIVGGTCVGARHCTQRRVADHYAVLLCDRVLDDNEPGDVTMQNLWRAYAPWREKQRFHFDVK